MLQAIFEITAPKIFLYAMKHLFTILKSDGGWKLFSIADNSIVIPLRWTFKLTKESFDVIIWYKGDWVGKKICNRWSKFFGNFRLAQIYRPLERINALTAAYSWMNMSPNTKAVSLRASLDPKIYIKQSECFELIGFNDWIYLGAKPRHGLLRYFSSGKTAT